MTAVKRATFLASLGAGLEYYDFIIYGMMAGTLSALFFSGDVAWIATMKGFGIFAVGYIARPIGGILFGLLGDTYGRKTTFINVMLLMALSTFAIGLLPTYSQIGSLASLILVSLRLLQGISFGAELPGAITVVCEYTEKRAHGSHSGFVVSSVSIGSMLASLVLYIVTNHLDKEQLLSWGWRIPFLLGGTLAIVNFVIRKQLAETPAFVESRSTTNMKASFVTPLITLFKSRISEVIAGIGMTCFISALVIFVIYMPTYLKDYYRYDVSDIYLSMTCGLVWSAISLPLCGWLADRVNKSALYIATAIAFMLGAFPLFEILNQVGMIRLVAFMCIYQTVISLLSVCYFPLLVNIFPTQIRYTGIAVCYNLTYALMGTLPIVITSLIHNSGTPYSAIWVLIGLAGVSAATSGFLYRVKQGSPI